MTKFVISYYNGYGACNNNLYVKAKNEEDAERLFWKFHENNPKYDINNISEVEDQEYFTEELIDDYLKNLKEHRRRIKK